MSRATNHRSTSDAAAVAPRWGIKGASGPVLPRRERPSTRSLNRLEPACQERRPGAGRKLAELPEAVALQLRAQALGRHPDRRVGTEREGDDEKRARPAHAAELGEERN